MRALSRVKQFLRVAGACLLLGSAQPSHAGTEAALYIYACFFNQYAECREASGSQTPPFETCSGWAGWAIPLLDPAGAPYTFQEVTIPGGKQCLINHSGGGLAARSIAYGFCQNPGYKLSGTAPEEICIADSTVAKVARQLGGSETCCGDPINPAPSVGNKYEISLDYKASGPFPLKLERFYNSAGMTIYPGNQMQSFAMANWRHTYERKVVLLVRAAMSFARVDRQDGNSLYFTLSGSDWLPEDADIVERLEQTVENGQSIWKFTNRDDEVERYDQATGRFLSITNRAALTHTLDYDSAGRLQSVTDAFGRVLRFYYGAANCSGGLCVASVEDPAGNVIQYGYDSVFLARVYTRLGTVIFPGTATPLTYNYDPNAPDFLTGIVDENGAATATWAYASVARSTLSERAGGAGKVILEYLSGTSVRTTTSVSAGPPAANGVVTYQFETSQGVQRVISITGDACPTCGPAAASYDTNGFPVSRTDWNGNKTCYVHNSRGLEEVRTEGLASGANCASLPSLSGVQRRISTQWHATYRLPTQIAQPLRITTMAYGAPNDSNPGNRGSLLSRTIQATTDTNGSQGFSATPTGTPRTWTYTYNANGQVLTIDGPRTDISDVTTYTYYANNVTCSGASTTGCRGQIQTITNAASHVTQITEYNAHGQPLSTTDPNGLVTTFAYDSRTRLTSRNVGGETSGYTYDNAGQLTRVTLPDGSYLNYKYDQAHRLTEIEDNAGGPGTPGNRISYVLDLAGNRIRECVFAAGNSGNCGDPGAQPVQNLSREYNNLSRLTKLTGGTNPAEITEYTLYDNNGNLKIVKYALGDPDPLGNEREYSYDELNRLVAVTDPKVGGARALTQYAYDDLDQLSFVRDPRSIGPGSFETVYAHDGLNNLNQQVSPDTGTTVNTYDAAGNLATSTDAKSQLTTYTYDALNRVTSISYQSGVAHTFQYDQGAYGKGRLTKITEPNSVTDYVYDQKGRLSSETRTINSVAYVMGYSYDALGRMTGMTYPSGRALTYSYDLLGRVSLIVITDLGTPQTVVSNVTYHPFGGVKSFTLGNGQTYTRVYDQDGRVASYTLATQILGVGYDAAGRVSLISETGNPSNNKAYSYDNLDRLTIAAVPGTSFGYGYDAAGNRLTKSVVPAIDMYTPSATSNRLSSITPAAGPVRNFLFDLNGSTTNDAVNQFAYDTRGRMSQAISVASTTNYQVNSLGQRIRKMNPQGDTVYHYDAQGRLNAESTAAGVVLTEYIYLGDIPVAILR